MKSWTRPAALLASLLLATATFLSGCASLGIGQAAEVTATLQTVGDDYHQAQLQAAATGEALDELAISADLDLKQSFDSFSANADRMEQIGKRLVTHADGMDLRGVYYFVETPKSFESCAYPLLGKSDDQRSAALGENFSSISEAGGLVKRAFRAYQFDIEQLNNYLANNLTPAGIDTIDQILRKAKVDGDSLQEALQQALKAVQRAKTTRPQVAQKDGQDPAGLPTP